MAYSEQDILSLIKEYNQGGRSLWSLAQEFGILRSTLRHRLSSTQPHWEASEPQQTLSMTNLSDPTLKGFTEGTR
jgi:transposase-like protein